MSDAFIESLESRRFFAGNTAFDYQIDFQTASTPSVPAGYRSDVGGTYARRPNGLKYGWNDSHVSAARQRNDDDSPDQRYDTFTHFSGDDAWSIAVPNGRYVVRVVAGDPSHTDSNYKMDVEGQRVIDGRPRGANPWVEGAVEVVVRDKRITLTSAAGAENNKIAFIEIGRMKPGDTTITWTSEGAPRALRGASEPAVTQVGRRLFVMGGYVDGGDGPFNMPVSRRVEVYNLETQKWKRLRDMPAGAPETHMVQATDGTYIYSVGGQLGGGYGPGTTQSWRYHIGTDTWERWVDFPQIQYLGAMSYVDGGLYFSGGNAADRATPVADHWAISTTSRNPRWVRRAPLPEPGDHQSRAVVNGKIYSIGGEEGHAGVDFDPEPTYVQHNYLFEYDPKTDVWTRKADLPIAASHSEGTTLVLGTKIVVMAGLLGPERHSASVRVYDTLTDEWSLLADLPDARIGPAAAVWRGRIYFSLGYSPKLGFPTESYYGTLGTV